MVFYSLIILTFVLFIVIVLRRSLPRCISWLLSKLLVASVKVESVCFFPPSLKNIRIVQSELSCAIDTLGISSCFVNSVYRKFLVFYVNDVRVEKDFNARSFSQRRSSPTFQSSDNLQGLNKRIILFSPFLLHLLRVTSIYIFNVNVIILKVFKKCLFQCFVAEIKLEGLSKQMRLNTALSVNELTCRILHHVKEKDCKSQPCLAEAYFGIALFVKVVLTPRQLLFEDLRIDIGQRLEIFVVDGLFSLIAEQMSLADAVDEPGCNVNTNGETFVAISRQFIPETIVCHLCNTNVKLLLGTSQKSFIQLLMQDLVMELSLTKNDSFHCDEFLPLNFALTMHSFQLSCNDNTKLMTNLINLKLKCMREENEFILTTSGFYIVYNHDDVELMLQVVKQWLIMVNCPLPLSSSSNHTTSSSYFSFFNRLHRLSVTFEVFDCSVSAQFSESCLVSSGIKHVLFCVHNLVLDDFFENSRPITDLNFDVFLESWFCSIGEHKLSSNVNKKLHYWNSPLFVGVLLVKMRKHLVGFKLESMLDFVNCEWSLNLVSTVESICERCSVLKATWKQLFFGTLTQREESAASFMQRFRHDILSDVQLTITNVNLFFKGDQHALGIFIRVDKSIFDLQSNNNCRFLLDEIKLAEFTTAGPCFPCVKAAEIKHGFLYFSSVTVKCFEHFSKLTVNISSIAYFVWSAKHHNIAFSIFTNMLNSVERLKMYFTLPVNGNFAQKSSTRNVVIHVTVEASFEFTIKLSEECSVLLFLRNAVINCVDESFTFSLPEMIAKVEAGNLIEIHGMEIISGFLMPELSAQRKISDRLTLKENKAVKVVISSIWFHFPNNYNFAGMFHDKFLSVWKWLKFLHKDRFSKSSATDKLPPDLWIIFKEFKLTIADSVFEFRLHNNYDLLEDEYNESVKRWKMLEIKLEEFRKTRLHLPADKVENLYLSLLKKNADIYIRRSQQMYSSHTKSPLLTFHFDAEIFIMSDPTMQGEKNVMSFMKLFDSDSPLPFDIEFSTLWCRMISVSFKTMSVYLRDYPTRLLYIKGFHCWGTLIGAEQMACKRAKCLSRVELGEPFIAEFVERNMMPMKFYYDLSSDVEKFTSAYGPCWEPTMAEYNLATDLIFKSSVDPSHPLPFWDKVRLLLHGRYTMTVQQLAHIMHASLDPYNTAEQLEFVWTDVTFDWTNGRFIYHGILDIYVHTASKYDDCRFLHFPNLKLVIKLDWQCLCDPNDHHAVIPCASDKLPDYSSNQKHDSYRAFRSLNLVVSVTIETKPLQKDNCCFSIPSVLFYSNTLRWLENLKIIFSSTPCPIRRGPLFRNFKPRKIPLSRHFKNVRFSLSLHQFEICYWMSVAKQRGFYFHAKKFVLSSDHCLSLVPVNDGLKRRPLAVWNVAYMNSELHDGEVWLQSMLSEDAGHQQADAKRTVPVEKSYLLSLSRLSYGRETYPKETNEGFENLFMHRLVVHDLKGSWTKNNRAIVFGLFDSYSRNTLLRHNLSTEALRCSRVDVSFLSSMKTRENSGAISCASPLTSSASRSLNKSPIGHTISMLRKLIAEAESRSVVFSEDHSGSLKDQPLSGITACQMDDVLYRNWLIELINSQVLLKGCDTPGYIIMSASRAQILQTIHQPIWKELTLISKTTWIGSFECMQYYATVDPSEPNPSGDNVQWLTLGNIEQKDRSVISDFADLVGSGQGVGGVVGDTVGGGNTGNGVQLQRIVSRCGCQFFYVSYGDNVDPSSWENASVPPSEELEIWNREAHVDSFTLTHHDLKCSTNSLQYAMLLDIVNNLLLYVEPGKKEAIEKLQRFRFQLQLSSVEDQRKPILTLQNSLRMLISNLRWMEKLMNLLHKSGAENASIEAYQQQVSTLVAQIDDAKIQINSLADDLAMMIRCFKETQIVRSGSVGSSKDTPVPWRRRSEVCFKHAQWRLTETDGLLGIADIELSNFLYSKAIKTDDSSEHLLELGDIKVINCIPNQIYKDVLQPTELRGNIPIDRRCGVRIFCREKAAVGGISIKEHFEVNVVPVTLRITHQFFKTMMNFCFPERDSDVSYSPSDDSDASGSALKPSRRRLQPRRMNTIKNQDDIDKMKERAEKNKMFLYIKIPEVPIRVSYKGEKDKNIQDVQDFNFILPTLEYHNVTWTWLDFLLAMKADSKKALLSQAIKHKLQIKSNRSSVDCSESTTPDEEEKVRLLMGSIVTTSSPKAKVNSGNSGD